MKLTQIFAAAFTSCLLLQAQAAETKVDAVAAVVNNTVVLESEVTDMVNRVKKNAAAQGQTLPSDKVPHDPVRPADLHTRPVQPANPVVPAE